ncbi:unnamed protein product [Spirodela intermedia]|uniref:Uncharacterized protein n=2 Tax=Spirodela intermedia TaxID=51605 RepID=A0A7I8IT91_SPIIN|nr:unnamed protein product [Spirodela intermedia]CAA6661182.1 unnamed protein product [Spirodela intermedia]CAA7399496.1 unnamed protein product [Spirodela intermedia]
MKFIVGQQHQGDFNATNSIKANQ